MSNEHDEQSEQSTAPTSPAANTSHDVGASDVSATKYQLTRPVDIERLIRSGKLLALPADDTLDIFEGLP